MKVLMISTDRKIFEEKSAVRQRIIEYGSIVEELHIVIFSKKGFSREKIGDNVWIYPTNSLSRVFYILNAVKIGKRIIKDFKLSNTSLLITSQDPFETGLVGWFLSRATKVKLQFQIHTDFLSPHFSIGSALNKMRVFIALFLIPKADCIRVVSSRIKESVIKSTKIKESKIVILPIFVDVEKFRKKDIKIDLHKRYSQFDKIILIVSRLEKEKNISFAIRAFSETLKKYPEAGLVIVGDGSEMQKLKKMVDKYDIKKSVVFLGWQDDVMDYYKTADLFVSSSDYEGYGMSILTAYVFGLPILTTDVGLVGDVIKKDEVSVCGIGDLECFIDKMIIALSGEVKLLNKSKVILQGVVSQEKYLIDYKKHWRDCFIDLG